MSSSYTFSNPVTPPADLVTQGILDNISAVASHYADQMYNWGQGVFQNVMNVTNQNLGSLTQAANAAMSGAKTSLDAFNNSFMKDYQTLRTEGQNYANAGRQAVNAGGNESGQMQGTHAAIEQARQGLMGYGIDPSAGKMYHDLNNAMLTAGTASAVGAGQQSIRADTATGLGLQKLATDYGIQMPAISANFMQQQNQANSIKQNAITSAANTGANLMSLPNAYLNTAKVAYPPSGQSSQSRTQSTHPPQSSGNKSSGQQQSSSDNGNTPGGNMMASNDGGSGFTPYMGGGQGPGGGTGGDPSVYDYQNGGNWDQTQPYSNPWGMSDSSGNYVGNEQVDAQNSQPLDSSNWANLSDNSAPQDGPYVDSGSSYTDTTGMQADYSNIDVSPAYTGDYGGGSSDYTDESTYTGDYATGGAIPDPTTGGQVPPSASPSMGAQTDDVHAKLNAGEFVIPTDVAAWKGHEFFQKLIAQSRKGRATASAQGKPTSPPTGPVRFASQPMR